MTSLLLSTLFTTLVFCCTGEPLKAAGEEGERSLFAEDFKSHWYDGYAELSGYSLEYPRYGEARPGVAVTIFVTEDHSEKKRVKADLPQTDRIPAIKLNLMQDFSTGVYDYNMMTSAFVVTTERHGRSAGHPSKVSFSSQEWCGHVYQQALFDSKKVRSESHSYFDGEADLETKLEYPRDGIAEDVLLLWARQLAAPLLLPGESVQRPLLRSMEQVRLKHVPLEWDKATLSRSAEQEQVQVPAGQFQVDRYTVEVAGSGLTWTFLVEREVPRRIIQWSRSDGLKSTLLKSTRLQYWNLKEAAARSFLQEMGLQARPPRTP